MEKENSQQLTDRHKEIISKINSYYKRMSLNVEPNESIREYLNMTQAQLRSLSSEECGEISYILSQYSLYIQKEYNFQKSQHNWAVSLISYLVAKEGKNYGKYVKFEEKVNAFASENSYGNKLNKIIVETKEYIDSLDFISGRINQMANALIELQQTKRRIK